MTKIKKEKIDEIKLRIGGFEDRKTMAGILAENGYFVKIVEEEENWKTNYYVIIQK